jgi:hypothetical protein
VARTAEIATLPAYDVTSCQDIAIQAPLTSGAHDLSLELRVANRVVGTNRYPVHVVAEPHAPYPMQVIGDAGLPAALAHVGVAVGSVGPTVVAEDCLDAATGEHLRELLAAGGTAVVLAQPTGAAPHYPVPVELTAVEAESSVFYATTDSGALPSLPRRTDLAAETSSLQARAVVIRIDDQPFPTEAVVIAKQSVPGAITGTVVGRHDVGPGRLIFCQYRVSERVVVTGDAAACALLANLVRWAADPRPPTRVERVTKDDGRALTYYGYDA